MSTPIYVNSVLVAHISVEDFGEGYVLADLKGLDSSPLWSKGVRVLDPQREGGISGSKLEELLASVFAAGYEEGYQKNNRRPPLQPDGLPCRTDR